MDDRLIVGLDLPDAAAARALTETLGDEIGFYKIGLGLLATGGLDLARALKAEGKRVFLDMKLFDIGATVTAATRSLTATVAPDFLTVHGDPHVVAAAAEGRGDAPTKLLAITILTSLDRADLDAAPDPRRRPPRPRAGTRPPRLRRRRRRRHRLAPGSRPPARPPRSRAASSSSPPASAPPAPPPATRSASPPPPPRSPPAPTTSSSPARSGPPPTPAPPPAPSSPRSRPPRRSA